MTWNWQTALPEPQKLLQICGESAQQKDGQMKARFTDEQIIALIKEQSLSVNKLIRIV